MVFCWETDVIGSMLSYFWVVFLTYCQWIVLIYLWVCYAVAGKLAGRQIEEVSQIVIGEFTKNHVQLTTCFDKPWGEKRDVLDRTTNINGWRFGTCLCFQILYWVFHFINPTDEVIFFRGVGTPTTNQGSINLQVGTQLLSPCRVTVSRGPAVSPVSPPRLTPGSSFGGYGGSGPDASVETAARRVTVRQIS